MTLEVPRRLVVATRNAHKLQEILRICEGWPTTWLTHEQFDWPEVDEAGASYLDNALLKAYAVVRATGEAALADDSGIEVAALGGTPGPRSARYAGAGASDEQNVRALLRAVAGVPGPGRTARYRAVAAVVWPDRRQMSAEGLCEGTIRTKPQGSGGFGYDPIFEPAGWDRTMAELTPADKDRISHRGRALRALWERLAVP